MAAPSLASAGGLRHHPCAPDSQSIFSGRAAEAIELGHGASGIVDTTSSAGAVSDADAGDDLLSYDGD